MYACHKLDTMSSRLMTSARGPFCPSSSPTQQFLPPSRLAEIFAEAGVPLDTESDVIVRYGRMQLPWPVPIVTRTVVQLRLGCHSVHSRLRTAAVREAMEPVRGR